MSMGFAALNPSYIRATFHPGGACLELGQPAGHETSPMNIRVKPPAVPRYKHTPLFPLGKDKTPYRKLPIAGVKTRKVLGKSMLIVPRQAIQALAEEAFTDINHLLRPGHLKQLRKILDDQEASGNDKFVA